MNILDSVTQAYMKKNVPEFNVGDQVKVHIKIKEGNRERIQVFEGFVLKRQNGGIGETFTVRRIASGVGVEKTFPLHSPWVEKIEVVRRGDVRRAKLNYMRGRTGKSAKIKVKDGMYEERPVEIEEPVVPADAAEAEAMEAAAAAEAEAAAKVEAATETIEAAEEVAEETVEAADEAVEEAAEEVADESAEAVETAEETVEETAEEATETTEE